MSFIAEAAITIGGILVGAHFAGRRAQRETYLQIRASEREREHNLSSRIYDDQRMGILALNEGAGKLIVEMGSVLRDTIQQRALSREALNKLASTYGSTSVELRKYSHILDKRLIESYGHFMTSARSFGVDLNRELETSLRDGRRIQLDVGNYAERIVETTERYSQYGNVARTSINTTGALAALEDVWTIRPDSTGHQVVEVRPRNDTHAS